MDADHYIDGLLDGIRMTAATRLDPNNLTDLRELLMFHDRIAAGYPVTERIRQRFAMGTIVWRDEWEAMCRSLGPARPPRPVPASDHERRVAEEETWRPNQKESSENGNGKKLVGRKKEKLLSAIAQEIERESGGAET